MVASSTDATQKWVLPIVGESRPEQRIALIRVFRNDLFRIYPIGIDAGVSRKLTNRSRGRCLFPLTGERGHDNLKDVNDFVDSFVSAVRTTN